VTIYFFIKKKILKFQFNIRQLMASKVASKISGKISGMWKD